MQQTKNHYKKCFHLSDLSHSLLLWPTTTFVTFLKVRFDATKTANSLSLFLSLHRFHPFNLLTQNICSKCSGWHQSTLLFRGSAIRFAFIMIQHVIHDLAPSQVELAFLASSGTSPRQSPDNRSHAAGPLRLSEHQKRGFKKGRLIRNTNGTNSCKNTSCHRNTELPQNYKRQFDCILTYSHGPESPVQGRAREGQVNAIGTWHWHVCNRSGWDWRLCLGCLGACASCEQPVFHHLTSPLHLVISGGQECSAKTPTSRHLMLKLLISYLLIFITLQLPQAQEVGLCKLHQATWSHAFVWHPRGSQARWTQTTQSCHTPFSPHEWRRLWQNLIRFQI